MTGLVFGFNRGGFDVLVYGMRAFCPVSAMALENIEDPAPLLGKWAEFHVQSAKSGNQGLVVSRRSILEKEARKRAKALLKSLEPGQVIKGRVTQVRDYGIFIDIGGIEGLAHQSELSWEHGVRPADIAKPGDELEVKVLKVHERENKREKPRPRVALAQARSSRIRGTRTPRPSPRARRARARSSGRPSSARSSSSRRGSTACSTSASSAARTSSTPRTRSARATSCTWSSSASTARRAG